MPKLLAQNLTEDQINLMKEPSYQEDKGGIKLHPAANVSDLSQFHQVDVEKEKKNLRGFYEKQNALISVFSAHAKSLNQTAEPLIRDEKDEENGFRGSIDGDDSDDLNLSSRMIQSAIVASFMSNVLLLILKVWMALLTGSMAIIASAADSLLDLVSGIVLVVADRMAHNNVDFYKYPEGRSRVEPIGVIIFATVMCLSSIYILVECLKIIIDGLIGSPPNIVIGTVGFVVLGLTIGIKLALYVWCQIVVKATGGSSSIEAYAQDHMNDVLTNSVAVACVILATQLKGFWIADPLGAAIISVWIIYSWWETGKEHVSNLSGHVASVEFLQKCTFIAANCDDLILKVDTVRAYHFGEKFLVEVHVVLDENLPLRVAHDVGEKLELMVEKMEEVDRCFVHMDYEYEHAPEYKRRQESPKNSLKEK